jgi:hypothetical protein
MHNFYGVQNKINNFKKGSFIDPYDEPTYLTFALDFHFESLNNQIMDPIECSPLFEEPAGDNNSAMAYLGSNAVGSKPREEMLRTFKSILRYLTFEAPWYFQEISGLGDMWTASTNITKGTKETSITITTLEAVDLRVTELASLYRNAIYDKHNLRERVPDNLRWFTMDIYVAETRNMRYTLPGAAGNLLNNTQLGGFANSLVTKASTITSSFSDVDPTSTMEQFGYVKFKCRQCEFDFSESFPTTDRGSLNIETSTLPASNKFKIKIGYFEEEANFFDGTELYDNELISKIKDPWEARGKMQNVRDKVNSVSNLPFVKGATDKINAKSQKALEKVKGLVPDSVRAAITKDAKPIGNNYPEPTKRDEVKALNDKYPDFQAPPAVTSLGDNYADLPPGPAVNDLGDNYANPKPAKPVSDLGDVYP